MVVGRERDIERLLQTPEEGVTRFIRGARCKSEEGCLQEWAAALQFPYYFGGNWDAFDECMHDLSWLKSTAYTLVITNADKLLADEQKEFKTLVSLLNDAATQWKLGTSGGDGHQGARFSIVLHCEKENIETLESRISKQGVEADAISVPALDNIF
jgi:hypothetical protein